MDVILTVDGSDCFVELITQLISHFAHYHFDINVIKDFLVIRVGSLLALFNSIPRTVEAVETAGASMSGYKTFGGFNSGSVDAILRINHEHMSANSAQFNCSRIVTHVYTGAQCDVMQNFQSYVEDNLIVLMRELVELDSTEILDHIHSNSIHNEEFLVIHASLEKRVLTNSTAMRLLVEFNQPIGHTGSVSNVPYNHTFFAPNVGRTTCSLMLADNVKDKYTSDETNVVEVWLLIYGENEEPEINDKYRDDQLRKELVLTSFLPVERYPRFDTFLAQPQELHSVLKMICDDPACAIWNQSAENIRKYWIDILSTVVPDESGMLFKVNY